MWEANRNQEGREVRWAGEMRYLVPFQRRTQVNSQHPHSSSQLSVIVVPDQMSPSGHLQHQACIRCTGICAGKTTTPIKITNVIENKGRKETSKGFIQGRFHIEGRCCRDEETVFTVTEASHNYKNTATQISGGKSRRTKGSRLA